MACCTTSSSSTLKFHAMVLSRPADGQRRCVALTANSAKLVNCVCCACHINHGNITLPSLKSQVYWHATVLSCLLPHISFTLQVFLKTLTDLAAMKSLHFSTGKAAACCQ